MSPEHGWKLLLVEDDADSAEALVSLFELHEIETIWATDGASAVQTLDAIERLDQRPPDFVLLDINLPHTDTVELVAELQNRLTGCPVVLVSATSPHILSLTAAQIGAVAALRKPFSMDRLLGVLHEHAPSCEAVSWRAASRR